MGNYQPKHGLGSKVRVKLRHDLEPRRPILEAVVVAVDGGGAPIAVQIALGQHAVWSGAKLTMGCHCNIARES